MRITFLIAALLLLPSLSLAEGFTGEEWTKHSDEFKTGFLFGTSNVLQWFKEDNEKVNEAVVLFSLHVQQCMKKSGLAVHTVQSAIDGYLYNNPNERRLPMSTITFKVLSKLCPL